MAVKMRMTRMGTKKKPFYRIVIADSEARRDGRFIEVVGTYNPLKNPAEVTLKDERVRYWMGEGVIPSDTVRSLLKKNGLMESVPA